MHLRARPAVLALLAIALVQCSPAPSPTPLASAASAPPSNAVGLARTPRPSPSRVAPSAPPVATQSAPSPTPSQSAGTDLVQTPPCPGHAPTSQRIGPAEANETSNWAGFVVFAPAGPFTCVEGRWTEPVIACSTTAWQAASFWVGLDGWNEEHLEQIGTEAQCLHGRVEHFAWHEILPREPNSLHADLAVRAGDQFWGRVLYTGGAFTLTLVNLTTHQSFTVRAANRGAPRASAEWVAESPSSGCPSQCRILSLPKFRQVTFTGTFTTAAGVRGSIVERGWIHDRVVATTGRGAIRLDVSTSASNGQSFSVVWRRR